MYMYTEANLKWQWISKSDHFLPEKDKFSSNIARGTADPEIDFVTWTKFGNHMAQLALVANLVAPSELAANLVTRRGRLY